MQTSISTSPSRAERRAGYISESGRPTMASAISFCEIWVTSSTRTIRPSRSTATRSAISSTSSRRCDVKITAPPPSVKARIRSKSLAASIAERTAVGSSIRMIFGRRAKALASSIICQSETGRSRRRAFGEADEPSSASIRAAPASLARRSMKGPRTISRPRKTFSATLRWGARQNS